jgi:hypothetical protein
MGGGGVGRVPDAHVVFMSNKIKLILQKKTTKKGKKNNKTNENELHPKCTLKCC